MNDTRALLNRIAQFRQRLEAMPRLLPDQGPAPAMKPVPLPTAANTEAASRTQAILESSLRKLSATAPADPPTLIGRARRLLSEAQGMVTRLRALADDPLLAGPPAGPESTDAADPLAVHYRETAALTGAAVRYAMTFPESGDEQRRLCEGLEGIIDAARRRFDLLAGAMEARRADTERIDRLARFLLALDEGDAPLDPAPLLELADEILTTDPGRPLRFLAAEPTSTQANLGGVTYRAPARFVAAHSLNCASIVSRIGVQDAGGPDALREAVVAALLHDVGMLRIDVALLAHAGPLDAARRRMIEVHARAGAERIISRLPGMGAAADAAASHHERADGHGYPGTLVGDQITPLARLIAAVDVYAAMCAPRPHRPALDPRAALTDTLLLAERGRLDRYATERLLAIGLYPAGTVVELADGATALVLTPRDPRGSVHAAARPTVAVLADPNGRPLANPRFLDLAAHSSISVIRTLEPVDRLRRLGRSFPEWA